MSSPPTVLYFIQLEPTKEHYMAIKLFLCTREAADTLHFAEPRRPLFRDFQTSAPGHSMSPFSPPLPPPELEPLV